MSLSSRTLAVSRERPHLLIAGVALFLIMATILLKISLPMVALAMIVLLAGLATLIRPEIGLHVLVLNAVVGLTHVVDMPRLGPLSAPILIEGLVVGAIIFQVAFFGRSLPLGTKQHLLLGLLAAWILISVLSGVTVGPENFAQYRNLFLVRCVMFFLVSAIMTTSEHLKRLLVTFLIANVGLLATATLVRIGFFGEDRITISQDFERTGALVLNPNELAFTLTTMLVLAIVAFLYVKRGIPRAFLMALAAANLFAIMSTLSRSGFISLCVVMTFLLVKLTRNLQAVGVVVLIIIAGALMMPEELFARFSHIDQVRDVDRIQIVQVGAAMAFDHPLFGVGLGNYVSNFWDYNVSNMKQEAPAHNMYLDLAAQMGFPSLILYLSIFGITWAGLRRMELDLKEKGRTRSFLYLFNLGLQAFLLNLAIFGLSGDVEFDYGAFIMLGAALTLLAEHRRLCIEETVGAGASGRN